MSFKQEVASSEKTTLNPKAAVRKTSAVGENHRLAILEPIVPYTDGYFPGHCGSLG